MNHCQHCGQPTIVTDCRDCDGYGGSWAQTATWADVWQPCRTCHDANGGRVRECVNLDCPGKRWYPLDGRCAALVRTARTVRAKGGAA